LTPFYEYYYLFIFQMVIDGAFLGLVLEFSLPASSYATMALREIIKMDMSAEFQTSLNDAGGTKHPAPAAATAAAAAETVSSEPEEKRIKLEPDADPAPPAVGIESSEDPATKKIKKEPNGDPPAVGIEDPAAKKIKKERITSD
jgi:tRNA pseudouridine13 synthase